MPISMQVFLRFATLVSLATGIGFGIVPALRASRGDLMSGLRASRTSSVYFGSRGCRITPLLVGQFALCMVVVAIAGLLALSLYKLRTLDVGFSRDQVVMFEVKTGKRAFTPERRAAFYEALLDRLRQNAWRAVDDAGRPKPHGLQFSGAPHRSAQDSRKSAAVFPA